jgi:hypothetical protein
MVSWLLRREGVPQQNEGDFSRAAVDKPGKNLAGRRARFSQAILVYIIALLSTKEEKRCPS